MDISSGRDLKTDVVVFLIVLLSAVQMAVSFYRRAEDGAQTPAYISFLGLGITCVVPVVMLTHITLDLLDWSRSRDRILAGPHTALDVEDEVYSLLDLHLTSFFFYSF